MLVYAGGRFADEQMTVLCGVINILGDLLEIRAPEPTMRADRVRIDGGLVWLGEATHGTGGAGRVTCRLLVARRMVGTITPGGFPPPPGCWSRCGIAPLTRCAGIAELAGSLQENGQAVPILVRPAGDRFMLLHARPPLDAAEERRIRKLVGGRHAPGGLDPSRADDRAELGWAPDRRHRVGAWLRSADGTRTPPSLQRRGDRRSRRSPRLGTETPADRDRTRRDPEFGRDRSSRPTGTATVRRA